MVVISSQQRKVTMRLLGGVLKGKTRHELGLRAVSSILPFAQIYLLSNFGQSRYRESEIRNNIFIKDGISLKFM